MNTPHKCPRCLEWTSEKFYCIPCRDYLKHPPYIDMRRKHQYWTEHSHTAGGSY